MHLEGLNWFRLQMDWSQVPKPEFIRCWKWHHRDADAAETAAVDENGRTRLSAQEVCLD